MNKYIIITGQNAPLHIVPANRAVLKLKELQKDNNAILTISDYLTSYLKKISEDEKINHTVN